MPPLTTHPDGSGSTAGPVAMAPATLHLAFDLGNTTGLLASSPAVSAPPRVRKLPARDLASLWAELQTARRHFGLAADAPVVSCYEAGRDAFWLHRALSAHGIANAVVDSASIEVNRRRRQRKTDRLDATALLRRLQRYHAGEAQVWRVVRVPTVAEEDRRHLHRELARLTTDRTRCINEIKGLLAAHGARLTSLRGALPQLAQVRQWDGTPFPPGVQERVALTYARLALVRRQRTAIVQARRTLLETSADPTIDVVRRLLQLRGIGEVSAWLFAMELFTWRRFRNRRAVAGISGPHPDPPREWTAATRERHREGRLTPAARARDRSGVELVAAATDERLEPVIPRSLRDGRVADAADWDHRDGAAVDDRALAVYRDRASPRGSDAESLTPCSTAA